MSGTSIGNATSLVAASLQPTDVIPVERPGVTTPYKAKLSSLSQIVSGAINVKDYGAVGDGVTDDTAAIQAAIDAAGDAGGGSVFVPPTDSYYLISYAISVPSNVHIFGVGEKSHIYHKWLDAAPDGWPGASWFYKTAFAVGNWGGFTEDPAYLHGPCAIYGITYYGIAAASAGDFDITLDTAGDISHFSEGDIIFIKSGEVFTNQATYNGSAVDVPLFVQTNKIHSISGATITLVDPLHHDFGATSSAASADQGATTGLDGQPVYMAENVTIENIKITMEGNGFPIYASGWNLRFEKLNLYPYSTAGIGANPLAHTDIRDIYVYRQDRTAIGFCLEVAYLSNDVLIDGLHSGWGRVNLAEPGSFITLKNFYLGEGGISTVQKHDLLIADGSISRRSFLNGSAIPIDVETRNNTVRNVTIRGIGADTASVLIADNTQGAIVEGCHIIAGPTAGKSAIEIYDEARNYVVRGNVIGKYGARTAQDIIENNNLGADGKVYGNISLLSKPSVSEFGYLDCHETDETVKKTLTIPAGSLLPYNSIKITAYGKVSGTNDAKTIRLRAGMLSGNPAIITASFAAAEVNSWSIEVIISAVSTTHINWVIKVQTANGTNVTYGANNNISSDISADTAITLTTQVANASDKIYLMGWIVEQLNDQWTI